MLKASKITQKQEKHVVSGNEKYMGNILEGSSRELMNSLINSVGQCFIEMLTFVHLVIKFFASYGTEGLVDLFIPYHPDLQTPTLLHYDLFYYYLLTRSKYKLKQCCETVSSVFLFNLFRLPFIYSMWK